MPSDNTTFDSDASGQNRPQLVTGILVPDQVNHTATGTVFVESAEPPAIHWRVGLKNGDRIISDLVMAGDIVSAIQQASARNLGAVVISAKEDQPVLLTDQELQALLQRNNNQSRHGAESLLREDATHEDGQPDRADQAETGAPES